MTFLLPLISISCNGDEIIDSETGVQQESSIFGSWQLVEQWYGSILYPTTWEEVSSGYEENIIFYKNNMYYSSKADICSSNPSISGHFKTGTTDNYNFIAINFSCTDNAFNNEYINIYTFENNYLILSPIDVCDEGCSFKYKKIAKFLIETKK